MTLERSKEPGSLVDLEPLRRRRSDERQPAVALSRTETRSRMAGELFEVSA